jgi:transcriptional regulator with XRE-family HTH domain
MKINAQEIIESQRVRIKALRGRLVLFAKEPGLDISWVSKYANGHIPNPGIKKIQAVEEALIRFGKPG